MYREIKEINSQWQDSPFCNKNTDVALSELDELFEFQELSYKTRNGNSLKSFLIDVNEYHDCKKVFTYLGDQIATMLKEELKSEKKKS
jgi:hypothetical protein